MIMNSIDPQSIKPGESAYVKFYSQIKKCELVEYNFRDHSGNLHACVCKTLEECKSKMEKILLYYKLKGDK